MPSFAVDRRLLIRAGIALVAILVLGGSAAAFAYTQSLKLGRAPMVPTKGFARLFAPSCACPTAEAELVFLVRKRDRATVSVVDGAGATVRTLAEDQDVRKGRVTFAWDGRDDAGQLVPDGPYRVMLRLAEADRTVLVPTSVRVDSVAPEGTVVKAGPTTISPNADGRNDSIKVRYRSSGRARAILLVNGQQVVTTPRRKKGEAALNWKGRLNGRPAAQGTYALSLVLEDRAGNRSAPIDVGQVEVRYLRLETRDLSVPRRGPLRFAVSTDAESFTWRLVRPGRDGKPDRDVAVRTVRPAQQGETEVEFAFPEDGTIKPGRYLLRAALTAADGTVAHEDETLAVVRSRR